MKEKEIVAKLEKETKRFQEKLGVILKTIKVIDKRGTDLLTMANAYYKDSHHFLKKEDLVSAFEAVNIAWGYIDSGLRLGFFEVQLEFRKWFTID